MKYDNTQVRIFIRDKEINFKYIEVVDTKIPLAHEILIYSRLAERYEN